MIQRNHRILNLHPSIIHIDDEIQPLQALGDRLPLDRHEGHVEARLELRDREADYGGDIDGCAGYDDGLEV